MSTLSIENITLKYNKRTLVEGVTFCVKAGEIVALSGPNGIGKSTLLRRIASLESYELESQGGVFVDGIETLDMSVAKRCGLLGIVFQNPDTQSFCTEVLDELAFGLENLMVKRSDIVLRTDAVLKMLEIEHLRHRKIASLSGGERQLVTIAAVLAMNAKILLADEITARIDKQKRPLIHKILKEFAANGGAVLMVSHKEDDLKIASKIVDLKEFLPL